MRRHMHKQTQQQVGKHMSKQTKTQKGHICRAI